MRDVWSLIQGSEDVPDASDSFVSNLSSLSDMPAWRSGDNALSDFARRRVGFVLRSSSACCLFPDSGHVHRIALRTQLTQ